MCSLPTELWDQIFHNFCIHCQQPKGSDEIIDLALPEALEGQKTLKALCLVSRDFRTISQRILFHSFYNLSHRGEYQWVRKYNPEARNLIPEFLRSLISNPPLRSQVRMVSLLDYYEPESLYNGITRADLQEWSQVSADYHVQEPVEVVQALALQGVNEEAPLYFDHDGDNATLRGRKLGRRRILRKVGYWLVCLVLTLTPRLTHLHMSQLRGSFEELQAHIPVLPHLRAMTCGWFHGMYDAIGFITRCPNLSSLTLRSQMPQLRSEISGDIQLIQQLTFTNIRKLSICCYTHDLSLLLQICPYLEDLEFHFKDMWLSESMEWPAHTKSRLRRLAWSNHDAYMSYRYDARDVILPPLEEFSRLEILEIDQASLSLYLESPGSPLLPGSIRILHIAYALKSHSKEQISDQLLELAYSKAKHLPKLSIVKIDYYQRFFPMSDIFPETLPDNLATNGLHRIMADHGIELQLGLEDYPWGDGCILQKPVGNSRVCMTGAHYQQNLFSLEDLQTL